jgi:uncharacterized RDD family membrane protein YckC
MSYGNPGGYPPQGGYPPPQGGYPPPGGGYQQGGYPPPGNYGYGAPPAYADIGKRIAAVIIDVLIVIAGEIPGFIVMGIGAAMPRDVAGLFGILGYLLAIVGGLGVALYNIYLLGRDGATLGKRFMKIKVLDPSGQPLGFGKAFVRELVKGLVGGFCFILLLWPLWDQEKQGLQDKVFSTHVYNV